MSTINCTKTQNGTEEKRFNDPKSDFQNEQGLMPQLIDNAFTNEHRKRNGKPVRITLLWKDRSRKGEHAKREGNKNMEREGKIRP